MSSVRLARKETHHVFASVDRPPRVSSCSVAGPILTPSNFAISSHLARGRLRRRIDRHRGLDSLSRIRAISIGVLGHRGGIGGGLTAALRPRVGAYHMDCVADHLAGRFSPNASRHCRWLVFFRGDSSNGADSHERGNDPLRRVPDARHVFQADSVLSAPGYFVLDAMRFHKAKGGCRDRSLLLSQRNYSRHSSTTDLWSVADPSPSPASPCLDYGC